MSFKLQEYEEARDTLQSLLDNYKKIQEEELAIFKKRISCEVEFKKYEHRLHRNHFESYLESFQRNVDRELSKIEKNEYISTSKPTDSSKIALSKFTASTAEASRSHVVRSSLNNITDHSSTKPPHSTNFARSNSTAATTSTHNKGVSFAVSTPLHHKRNKEIEDKISKEIPKNEAVTAAVIDEESKNIDDERGEKTEALNKRPVKNFLSRLFSCSRNK